MVEIRVTVQFPSAWSTAQVTHLSFMEGEGSELKQNVI